ncbi:histidine acid phosphatase-like protein [Patellaria atrata CBS 101060]|uniref:Histidine acid phosphatase-like protein n=1 Tax=Patellaria atrata CBS 101060 TaxID=1346257 RepID=A0A9P4SB08_9PEZI|nr:histidine acid phosphatase-like protein [Patellaria atrata CBS 101060]
MEPRRGLKTLKQGKDSDLGWYPPNASWINNLSDIINGTGVHGFIFNSSELPNGIPYRTYNWCNMPHVRQSEYPVASSEYELEYVEVIHRHHKRTPYASNTFPNESFTWDCSDTHLFTYSEPLESLETTLRSSVPTYWDIFTSPSNPFTPAGFPGTCLFPQITNPGLEDSYNHGANLYSVYHDLLSFLPDTVNESDERVKFRVTNNPITSQVASMIIAGMYPSLASASTPITLMIQPPSVDSLEPSYSCPRAAELYANYAVGSQDPQWTAHLKASAPLFAALDTISGVSRSDVGWHRSWDHCFDNLSARQCHGMPLPCSSSSPKPQNTTRCITQTQADAVYRLGQYEYSFIHRDSKDSLRAAVASFGVWIAELAQNIRDQVSGNSGIIFRHNVAHDGSMARLLAVLQVETMVWPGMGSEVVFEVFKKGKGGKRYLRVLWGGRVLRSSVPELGSIDMLDLDVFLGYVDGLVGKGASKIPELCGVS